jgi:hypothetical protein
VSVMLARDTVALYRPGGTDAHGWRDGPPEDARPCWCGPGNLQLGAGPSDPRAADAGGHGPFDPAARMAGALYLPPEARPAEGDVAVARGQPWVLSAVREVHDPADLAGFLDCWAATVTEVRDG